MGKAGPGCLELPRFGLQLLPFEIHLILEPFELFSRLTRGAWAERLRDRGTSQVSGRGFESLGESLGLVEDGALH